MEKDVERQFCELYRNYYFYIYKRAFYFFYDKEVSRDITQEVFYKVVAALEKGNLEVLKINYLTRLATNLCIDRLRKQKSGPPIHSDLGVLDRARAFNGQSHADNVIHLHQLLGTLPRSLREIAIYRLVDGYRLDEIAEITGLPKRTLQRKLDKIKRHLGNLKSE